MTFQDCTEHGYTCTVRMCVLEISISKTVQFSGSIPVILENTYIR